MKIFLNYCILRIAVRKWNMHSKHTEIFKALLNSLVFINLKLFKFGLRKWLNWIFFFSQQVSVKFYIFCLILYSKKCHFSNIVKKSCLTRAIKNTRFYRLVSKFIRNIFRLSIFFLVSIGNLVELFPKTFPLIIDKKFLAG